jgi:hypothetical protein
VARREHDDTCRVRRTCGLDLEIVVNEARSIALPAIGYGLFYQDYRFRLVDGTSANTVMTYGRLPSRSFVKVLFGRRGRFINARADNVPTTFSRDEGWTVPRCSGQALKMQDGAKMVQAGVLGRRFT